MDVWTIDGDSGDMQTEEFSKGYYTDTLKRKRNCRFPTLHESDKAITVVTEYFDDPDPDPDPDPYKSGILRTYFNSDYSSYSSSQSDEEKVFRGYKFVFTSAYF